MKDDDWITVRGWMMNRLHLEKAELIIFAVIYGYTKHGYGQFDGTIKHLENCSRASRSTVFKCLTSLQEKGYINKIDYPDGIPRYTTNEWEDIVAKNTISKPEKVAKSETTPPVQKSDPPPSKNRTTPVQKSDPTIYIKKSINKEEEALFEKNDSEQTKIDANSSTDLTSRGDIPAPPENPKMPIVSFTVVFDQDLTNEAFEEVTTALANNDDKALEKHIGKVNMKSLREVYTSTEAITMSGNLTLLLCYWLTYKHGKRQSYQAKGLATLISEMRKYDSRYVKEKLMSAMTSNYTGLFFPGEEAKYEHWKKSQQGDESHCELLNEEYTNKIELYLTMAGYDTKLLLTKDTGMLANYQWSPQAKIAATIWNFRLAYSQNSKVRFLSKENPNLFTFNDIRKLITMESKYTTSERCTAVWTALIDIQFENREKLLKEKGFINYIITRLAENN